jgi:periplasmic mercuric ion binding protein
MKIKIAIILLSLVSTFTIAQTNEKDKSSLSTVSFNVSGNCGMCKNRIEKSLEVDGVVNKQWDGKTKMIEVKFDAAKITEEKMHELIAESGHDTQKASAKEDVYAKLPG